MSSLCIMEPRLRYIAVSLDTWSRQLRAIWQFARTFPQLAAARPQEIFILTTIFSLRVWTSEAGISSRWHNECSFKGRTPRRASSLPTTTRERHRRRVRHPSMSLSDARVKWQRAHDMAVRSRGHRPTVAARLPWIDVILGVHEQRLRRLQDRRLWAATC
ncbi:hypothetical protein PENSPDRAFT_293188 [Peniophora sp. CONT]|nr:hypothetical protein PENSPDRAFT_293188 [Peniophora sp. CONT]